MGQEPRLEGLTVPEWLLHPEHAAQMGGALWVFLWLWREGAAGESPFVREVRGGAPVRVEEIGAGLGLPVGTVKRHLAQLREAGYLTTFREHHAFTAIVNLWRPGGEDHESKPKMGLHSTEQVKAQKWAMTRETMSQGPKMSLHFASQGPKMGLQKTPLDPP